MKEVKEVHKKAVTHKAKAKKHHKYFSEDESKHQNQLETLAVADIQNLKAEKVLAMEELKKDSDKSDATVLRILNLDKQIEVINIYLKKRGSK